MVLLETQRALGTECLNETGYSVIVDYGPSYHVNKLNTTPECVCDGTDKVCVRKCCSFGYAITNKLCMKSDSALRVPVHNGSELVGNWSEHFGYAFGMGCKEYYMLKGHRKSEDLFYVQHDGRLFIPVMDEFVDGGHFCVEHFEGLGLVALVCFKETDLVVHFVGFNVIGKGRSGFPTRSMRFT